MDSILTATFNLVALSALFWFFDVPYRKFRIDLLRCYLFETRDRLFYAARREVISYEDPAYGMTRQILNGMIRYAHEWSLWRVIVMLASHRAWDNPAAADVRWNEFEQDVAALPEHARSEILHALRDAHVIVVSHIMHISLLTFPLVICVKVLFRIRLLGRLMKEYFGGLMPGALQRTVDREAYLIGGCAE